VEHSAQVEPYLVRKWAKPDTRAAGQPASSAQAIEVWDEEKKVWETAVVEDHFHSYYCGVTRLGFTLA